MYWPHRSWIRWAEYGETRRGGTTGRKSAARWSGYGRRWPTGDRHTRRQPSARRWWGWEQQSLLHTLVADPWELALRPLRVAGSFKRVGEKDILHHKQPNWGNIEKGVRNEVRGEGVYKDFPRVERQESRTPQQKGVVEIWERGVVRKLKQKVHWDFTTIKKKIWDLDYWPKT